MLRHQTGNGVDRLASGQNHDEGFEQQSNSAAFPRPGDGHDTD
jgi:hypothetical protein